jgi:hypothetical protein
MSAAAPFKRPPGDPAAVFAAATSIGTASTSSNTALSTFKSGSSTALERWDAPIATDFATMSGAASNRMSATVTQLEGAAALVKGYGDALLAAQDSIDALTAQWNAHQDTIDKIDQAGNPSSGQQTDRSNAVREQGRIEGDATTALSKLSSIEKRIAGHIDEGTNALVPGAAGKTPEQLFNEVTAAWAGIKPTYAEIKRGVLTPVKIYSAVNRGARAALAVKAYADGNRAASLFNGVKNGILAQAAALLRDGGTYNRIPGQLGILARDIADARRIADDASKLSAARYANFYKAVVPASRFMKGLAVVGVVGSLYDLFANPLGETGARRNVSIGVDIIGAAAGGTALAASAGLIALGPVGVGIVAGGLIIAGAWAAGTYIYDHWDDITHGVDVAADWVGNKVSDAGDAIGHAADAVGNAIGGLGDAIGGLFG